MKNMKFYDDLDFRYNEIAIYSRMDEETGKHYFIIPVLTPFLNQKNTELIKNDYVSTHNIKNNILGLDISPINITNEIDIPLPLVGIEASKGDQFIVIFVGGDIDKPCIIGKYKDGYIE